LRDFHNRFNPSDRPPDGHTSYRDGGWQNSYFEPMKKHFGRGA